MASIETIIKLVLSLSNDESLLSKVRAVLHTMDLVG